ncbi:MAG: hypothetical protein A3J93_04765 [Candidatus Magasanikbacteria bacterium RIFOXYC2_FULL_42_28]|uniref:Uncharacterized protein n=1 Tax=Candidatus Magasanikbacteria bacterium RIFOXYC2_FULL_42_28 TaxID=1798704 RepID=A0A1F6NWN4_9BACT|nr:MAG: hypothetical protein A3J93_04765 [Candidatus Magasanikbacteria bacterium RIFOXYC2_FULL_42_28]
MGNVKSMSKSKYQICNLNFGFGLTLSTTGRSAFGGEIGNLTLKKFSMHDREFFVIDGLLCQPNFIRHQI